MEGLEQVRSMPPGVILLDLMMPEMDGFEFIHQLRLKDEWRLIPIIVVTAKDLTPEERDELNGHVSRVLQKGIVPTGRAPGGSEPAGGHAHR